ncbi:hypothetical protein [Sphingomonas sp. BK235]|uniref:hypothetical protein n=1 Tax=Sphingomonas sp. BK235 TaxID=2512131 RepID=UPI00104F5535|nr:hypothetical protein [Sphingomonas sp. BK235]
MKIRDFLLHVGLQEAEWGDWLKVKDAKGESEEVVLSNGPSERILEFRVVPADAGYARMCELKHKMAEKITSVLEGGDWKVSGRLGSPSTRQDLEEEDWASAAFDFVGNRLGGYTHIDFRRVSTEDRTENLKRFIEIVCKVVRPGTVLNKGVIEELAQALCGDQYQAKAFIRAWEKASISPDYKKPGRRRIIET